MSWAVFTHNSGGYIDQVNKCEVWLTAFRSRLIDQDNNIGGFKALIDSLTIAKFLRNDSPKWAVFHYDQKKVALSPLGKPCTEIKLALWKEPV